MRIRQATPDDWPAIWPIWHAVVSAGDTYAWDPRTSESEARAVWMLPPPAQIFVLEDDGGVQATALLKPNNPGLGDHVANASFMVSPNARGRGYGRALGDAVLAAAVDSGYRAMQFNAVVSTNEPAIALWRSLGFEIVGQIPRAFRHRAHGEVDLLVMWRTL